MSWYGLVGNIAIIALASDAALLIVVIQVNYIRKKMLSTHQRVLLQQNKPYPYGLLKHKNRQCFGGIICRTRWMTGQPTLTIGDISWQTATIKAAVNQVTIKQATSNRAPRAVRTSSMWKQAVKAIKTTATMRRARSNRARVARARRVPAQVVLARACAAARRSSMPKPAVKATRTMAARQARSNPASRKAVANSPARAACVAVRQNSMPKLAAKATRTTAKSKLKSKLNSELA